MLASILSVLMMAAQVDTAGCGIYPVQEAQEVLVSIVEPLLTNDDDRSGSILDLVAQPDTIQGFVETSDSVCAPLVQYYVDNMDSFSDESHLVAHGWTHALIQFGEYQILLVVPRSAPGNVGSPLPHLLFFDRQGQFVSTLGAQLP